MHSGTRPVVDQTTIDALVREVFGPEALPADGREASDGTYNAVFRLTLAGGREAVLKIAPAPDAPRLSYERDILRTEALFLSRAAALDGVPTPRVLATGFDRTLLPNDFLFMSVVPGRSLATLRAALPPAELAAVRADLGRVVAALHRVRGDIFGYPQDRAPGHRWTDTFHHMVKTVVADADRLGADLTRPGAEILAVVGSNLDLLEDVQSPVLVHFDLWDGNILVQRGEKACVGGVVDGERAFWGDPYADFVSLALFGDIESDADFLDGYRAAGGVVEFTPRLRRRLRLYRVYLYLIMLTEVRTRGDGAEEAGLRAWVGPFLAAELTALGERAVVPPPRARAEGGQ